MHIVKEERHTSTSDRSIVQSFLDGFDEEETEGDDEYFMPMPMTLNYHNLVKVENDAFSGNIPNADGFDKKVGLNLDLF